MNGFARRPATAFAAGFFLAAVLLLAPSPGHGQENVESGGFQDSRRFRRVSLAVTAGVGTWTLSSLESFHEARAEFFAPYGLDLSDTEYGGSAIYGAELQVRVTDDWYARAGAEWFRTKDDVRHRTTLAYLGGRRPLSMRIETEVASRPMLFSAGVGRAFYVRAFRAGVTGSAIVAPVRLEETFDLRFDTQAVSRTVARGIGLGLELAGSIEMYTDARMNLLVELYGRAGSTDVELEHPSWGGTNIPVERNIDFTGVGLRMGFRWI